MPGTVAVSQEEVDRAVWMHDNAVDIAEAIRRACYYGQDKTAEDRETRYVLLQALAGLLKGNQSDGA